MDEVLKERELEMYIRTWTLIVSSGGRFEVTVNGDLVFSKAALGRHAEPGEVKALIVQKVNEIKKRAGK